MLHCHVDLDRTTHVSGEALHSPVSGVATPRPCLSLGGVPSHARYPVRVAVEDV
jgi:hypothetical protein